MRKYAILLAGALVVGCADFGPQEETGRGRVVGTITEVPSGEPVENADIIVRTADGETTTFGRAVGGTYLVTRLTPGNYTVRIQPPTEYELAPGTLNDVPFQITFDETITVNFQLRSSTTTSTSVPPQARN